MIKVYNGRRSTRFTEKRKEMDMMRMLVVLVALSGFVVGGCGKKECEIPPDQCWYRAPGQSCKERTLVPDGAQCRYVYNSFCDISCVCQKGEAQVTRRMCDEGNPCTADLCEVESTEDGAGRVGSDTREKCFHDPKPTEGKACGPDDAGVCQQGLCVLYDGTVYLTPESLPTSIDVPTLSSPMKL